MTLSPSISRDVVGTDGPKPPPALTCAHPACLERAQERHHLWRRSQLAGVYDWVLVDGMHLARNVVDLCREHHRQVTENQAWIEFLPGADEPFLWNDRRDDKWVPIGMCVPDLDESKYCAECGQRKRSPSPKERRPPRKSRSLTIKVPDDEENGAEVFDTLVESLCDELGYEGSKGLSRYHACLAAMHFTLVNKEQFLAEKEGT